MSVNEQVESTWYTLFYYLSYQQEQQRAIYLFKKLFIIYCLSEISRNIWQIVRNWSQWGLLGKLRISEQGVTHEEASMSSNNKNEEGECLKKDTFLC